MTPTQELYEALKEVVTDHKDRFIDLGDKLYNKCKQALSNYEKQGECKPKLCKCICIGARTITRINEDLGECPLCGGLIFISKLQEQKEG